MKLKPGVKIKGIQPELVLGLMVANQVYEDNDLDLIVTSLMEEGNIHSPNSKHKVGLAADLRINTVASNFWSTLLRQLKFALGKDFDVVLESDHIHIEFDPR